MSFITGSTTYDIYDIEYEYSYDPGVRYDSDGSGTPPSHDISITKITTINEGGTTINVDYETLSYKTQEAIGEKCIEHARN